jgi:hypothetical protein
MTENCYQEKPHQNTFGLKSNRLLNPGAIFMLRLTTQSPPLSRFIKIFPSIQVVTIYLFSLMMACNPGGDEPSPDYIKSEEEAKAVLNTVYDVWMFAIKPTLPSNGATPNETVIIDNTFDDYSGTVRLTGNVKFEASNTSSSSGSTSFSSAISTISCVLSNNFEYEQIKFDGSLLFNDLESHYQVCSRAVFSDDQNCVGTGNASLAINATTLAIEFEYQGRKIKDIVTITGEYKGIWDFTITNKNGKEFRIYY